MGFLFYSGKTHLTNFTILSFLSLQFSGIKYTHNVVQPSLPSTSRALHFVKLKLQTH